MNYQLLRKVVPKIPEKWINDDVAKWLQFISLSRYTDIFKKYSIDGCCILSLEEKDLRQEIGITSPLIIRKLLEWIKVGFAEYQQYLNKFEDKQPTEVFSQRINQPYSDASNESQGFENTEMFEIKKSDKKFDLYLCQLTNEVSDRTLHISMQSTKIGRGSGNQIDIDNNGSECSRVHAQILKDEQRYFLRDRGSTKGTYIKVRKAIEIDQQSLIQIGSNLLQIKQVMFNKVSIIVWLSKGNSLQRNFVFENLHITIGRNESNEIVIQNDPYCCNKHCQIFYEKGRLFIKDFNTQNGTWIRLSSMNTTSIPHQLKNNDVIRFGKNISFRCFFKQSFKQVQHNVQNACSICYVNKKDCLLIPCNHTVCMKCSKVLRTCPACRIPIDRYIKIYMQ